MAKAKKTTKKDPAEAETAVYTDNPGPEAADSNDSFSDLGPIRAKHWAVIPVVMVLLVVVAFIGFGVAFAGKIYPGVSVNGVAVGGMKPDQAKAAVAKATQSYQQNQIPIQYGNTTLSVDLSQIGLSYDVDGAVADAYNHGRVGGWDDRVYQIFRGFTARPTALTRFSYNDAKLTPYISQITDQVDTAVANASLSFSDTGRVMVASEQAGQRVDIGRLVQALKTRIATGNSDSITAPVYGLAPSIDSQALTASQSQAAAYLVGPVTIKVMNKDSNLAINDIIKWITVSRPVTSDLKPGLQLANLAPQPPAPPVTLTLDSGAVASYVAGLAKSVDRAGQNAALTIENGQATVFQPSQTGYQLDQPAAVQAITAALSKPANDRVVTVAVKTIDPEITEASLNNLGINELISEGVTYFPGSPAARMQNIRVGASKFNGVLVKPDAVFSFESLLGDVGPQTGYAPALVILGNKEVYQYGGGMCQVSSTAYRAALLAGLPIVERHNHSFAVGYYTAPFGVPGVDATVFNLSVDLKFKNDTGHYILIQTQMQGTTLKFDFYGTKTKSGQIRGPYFIDPAGGAGWNATVPSTTVFYRDVLDLAGNVVKTDTITEHYKSSLDFPVVKELN